MTSNNLHIPGTIPSELISKLRNAQSVAVLTGAGISAESGVPTFRDALTGLWANYSPHELATPEAFQENPKLVWDWYDWRRKRVSSVDPNPGHFALAEMEKRIPKFTLATQNVDGLHQRGGARNVIELHGNITRVKCFDHHEVFETWDESNEIPPRCPSCNGHLRPDVVWFGEKLPEGAFEAATVAAETCELFFAIGTSGMVFPAASLIRIARRAGAIVVEINPEDTPFSDQAHHVLRGPSGVILPELVKQAWT